VPLSSAVAETIRTFRSTSRFAEVGGVVTDLDGTALHERDGRLYVHHSVAEGLKALVELGRPVVVNTLRFPLNVIRTFGREWGAITANPVPLVSLNGAVVGLLTPEGEADTTFEELAAFPLSAAEIEAAVERLEAILGHGLENLVVFAYPRDWREGEVIWTPHEDHVPELRAKYRSASEVFAGPVERLRAMLLARGACMLAVQADIPEDRRMAYQHADPNGFLTTTGVDKLSGAREAAARLDFDLSQSVGAGDTPMDCFLAGVGLAVHVGPVPLEFEGRRATIRLPDPGALGAALFDLARMEAAEARR
jgi:hydroxymethylpyrimidine pyrophosphatase-like HAD family hydrolase